MWSTDSWWLPTRNFAHYMHKPPLLFWLIHLGWAVFGVNEWWPRLLSPMLAVVNLWLIGRLSRTLWPATPDVERHAPLILMSSWLTLAYSTTLMFDTLMTSSVLLAAWGLARADRGERGGWALLIGGVALGLLTKGPVILVYGMPVAVAHRLWTVRPGQRWFRFLLPCLLVASMPILIWVLAIAQTTDNAHLRELLVTQTLARIDGTVGHGRPSWWYLPWLAPTAMPWVLWPAFWRRLRQFPGQAFADRSLRFVVIAAVSALLILSLIGGKQVHYLLPVWAIAVPGLAALLAQTEIRARDARLLWVPFAIPLALAWLPVRDAAIHADLVAIRPALTAGAFVFAGLLYLARRRFGMRMFAMASAAWAMMVFLCVFAVLGPRADLKRAAQFVHRVQLDGRDVAYVGFYQAEFGFLGRLTQPITSIETAQIDEWARNHPNGLVVGRSKRLPVNDAAVVYRQAYRSDELLMVNASSFNRPSTPDSPIKPVAP